MKVRDFSLWLLRQLVRLLVGVADLLETPAGAAAHARRTGTTVPPVPPAWAAQVRALDRQTAQLGDDADALQVADTLATAMLVLDELRTFYLSMQQADTDATQALNALRLMLPIVFQIYLRDGDNAVLATVLSLLIVLDRRMAEAGSEATYEERVLRWGADTVAAIGADDDGGFGRAEAVAALLQLAMVLVTFGWRKWATPKAPWLTTLPDDWRPVFRVGFDAADGDSGDAADGEFADAERRALSRAMTTWFPPAREPFVDEAGFKRMPQMPAPWKAGGVSLTILPVPAQQPAHGGAVALSVEGDVRESFTRDGGRHRVDVAVEPGFVAVLPVGEPLVGGGRPTVRAAVAYVYSRPNDGRAADGLTLHVDEARIEVVVESTSSTPTLTAIAALRGLALSAGGLLPFNGRTDLVLRWDTLTRKLQFEGGAGLELRKRIAVGKVGGADGKPTGDALLDAVLLARLSATQRDDGFAASAELLADVTLRIGRWVTVAAAGTGVRFTLASADDATANVAGLWAAAMDPVPPTGIGLAVAIGPVSGGGMLRVAPDRVSGVVELSLGKAFRLSGIGQYASRRQWLALVCIERSTPGPPFLPQGIGVLVARGRRADADALRGALGTGELDLVLMPRDVVANEARVIAALDRYFPPGDAMLLGLMLRFQSKGGTFSARVGVVAELPYDESEGIELHLLAVATIQVPSQKPWILDGVGLWHLGRSEGYLRLQLRDARLWGFEVTGSLVVLHGDPDGDGPVGKGTWIALGGFYPGYPVPGPALTGLKRLGVTWRHGDSVKLAITGYLAWTPSSLQFGIDAVFKASYSGFGFDGRLAFDALIASDWSCQIDFHAHLRFQVLGRTLAGFGVDCTYTATDRYRLSGTAHYEFLWIEGSKHFSCDLGERDAPRLPPGEIEQALAAELRNPAAWRVAAAAAVVLVDRPRGAVLPPDGRTYFEQAIVPLNVTIDLFGTQRLAAPRAFVVDLAAAGPRRSLRVGEFAPGLFFELTHDEALRAPVTVQHDSGIELQWPLRAGAPRDVDDDWEEIIVDPLYAPPKTPKRLLVRAFAVAAVTAAPPPVVVRAQAYRAGDAGPATWMHARAAARATAPPPLLFAAPRRRTSTAPLTEAWR